VEQVGWVTAAPPLGAVVLPLQVLGGWVVVVQVGVLGDPTNQPTKTQFVSQCGFMNAAGYKEPVILELRCPAVCTHALSA
jgi:hypothetical protein